MVSNVLSLTGNGLRDWLVQRVTAVILAGYLMFLLIYACKFYPLDYVLWHALFAYGWMKIFTVLALLSLVLHAWVGMWTVLTDYVKCSLLRLTFMVSIILALFAYFIWGIFIMWGVA